MARWQCKKCGVLAESKCVYRRNVFLDNQRLAEMEQILPIYLEPGREDNSVDKGTIHLRVKLWEGDTIEEKLQMVKNILEDAEKEGLLTQMACPHDAWELLSERCNLGCCVREKQPA